MVSHKGLGRVSMGKPVFHGGDRKKRRGRCRNKEGRESTGLK